MEKVATSIDLFENNGDTALQDIYINDVIPTNFEIKDWYIKVLIRRDDCEITLKKLITEPKQVGWSNGRKGERLGFAEIKVMAKLTVMKFE